MVAFLICEKCKPVCYVPYSQCTILKIVICGMVARNERIKGSGIKNKR